MPPGEETRRLEELLRRRGVRAEGDAGVEREILERYQDDCAVLILDSSGFTRITRERGIIHFLALVVALRDLAAPLFQRHRAIAWWAAGDNLYGVFPEARFAYDCAVALHLDVRAANGPRGPSERLEVCIGIGCGRMLRIGREDIYGDQMNLASKLGEDMAGPGEILLTEEAYEALRTEIPGFEAEFRRSHVSGVDIPHYRVRP